MDGRTNPLTRVDAGDAFASKNDSAAKALSNAIGSSLHYQNCFASILVPCREDPKLEERRFVKIKLEFHLHLDKP